MTFYYKASEIVRRDKDLSTVFINKIVRLGLGLKLCVSDFFFSLYSYFLVIIAIYLIKGFERSK